MIGSDASYYFWLEQVLRVGEMTQIRAKDIDFSKGYLHVQALNAKFKKPRTVVLLPKVAEVLQKQLAGRAKTGCS
jgi:integrase